jgi:hypothetical protein
MTTGRALLALALAATSIGEAAAQTGVPASVRQVAGEVSPLGWPYSSFTEATVAADGGLVFTASATAIFAADGTPPLAQRVGAGVTMPDGRRIAGVGPPGLASDGCTFVRATFETGGEAIVRACGTTFSVVVDAGTTAPGGGVIRGFEGALHVAGTAMTAFAATLGSGTNVLMRHDGGTLTEVARTGTGSPAGGAYTGFRLLGVATDGRVAFRATVSDGPDGIFVAGATVRAIAVVGQGSPSGGSFTDVGGGHLHPGGNCAFRADLSTGQAGLFVADLAGPTPLLQAIVLQGDPLPIAGATVRGFPGSSDPSINATGAVAFRGLVAGATDPDRPAGIFVWSAGTIAAVATVREVLGDVGTVSRLRDPVLADDGSVIVSAVVSRVGPGLFVVRDGTVAPLAVLGDATEVDTGDSRFRFGPARVTDVAEGAVFLGQRDAIFRRDPGGTVEALAYTGRPTPIGGTIAALGSPAVDGRGTVFFGADVREGTYNEALFTAGGGTVRDVLSPDRRLLGGGGILELFPTGVDGLARPGAASRGVVLTAALQGARASEAVFAAQAGGAVAALARAGQRAGGQRLARLGTPSTGPGGRLAFLAEVGRDARRLALVAGRRGALAVAALRDGPTRARGGGRFAQLGPPSIGRAGTAFRATLAEAGLEGVFVARGKRIGAAALSGDVTTLGARLRSFDDPLVVGDEVWFAARVAGGAVPTGIYRVRLARMPRKTDAPLPIEPVVLPGSAAPAPLGGVIVAVSNPRLGAGGIVSIVADVGGGSRPSAILELLAALP